MEIKIGKSARACCACGRAFSHEELLRSLVRLHEGVLAREDYCTACWGDERADGAFSLWSSRFFDPKVTEQEPPETFSPLRQAFYEAVESEDRNQLATAYLAAQLLRRQKVFRRVKEFEETADGDRIALFEDRIGNRLIEVRDPNLTYAEIEAGKSALMDRIGEFEQPEEAATVTDHAPCQEI